MTNPAIFTTGAITIDLRSGRNSPQLMALDPTDAQGSREK
jgi:hypothetical protein